MPTPQNSGSKSRRVIAAGLILIAGLAADNVVGLGFRNGWIDMNEAQKASGRLAYSPAIEPVTVYTGIPAIDSYLWGMLSLYWTSARAATESLALPLFTVYLAGQLLGTHTLVMLEGLRDGNRGKLVGFSSFWGIVFQNFVWGVCKPLYWAIWLVTSLIAHLTRSSSLQGQAQQAVDASRLRTLPWALFVGYVVPTIMASLPWPQLSTPERQQVWILIWLFFPACVALVQFVLGLIIPRGDSSLGAMARRLRRVYKLVIASSAIVHMSVICYILFPSLNPTAGTEGTVSFKSVFIPMAPWSKKQVVSLAEGFCTLLIYDWYYACGSTLLWAIVLLRDTGAVNSLGAITRAVIYSVLVGPAAAAVAMVWERDENTLLNKPVKV